MTDSTRNPGGKEGGRQNAGTDAMLALGDTIDDLESILETLESLGISTTDELAAYIDDLITELEHLESATGRS